MPPNSTAFVARPGLPSLRRKAAISWVSKKLGTTPEKLAETVQSGGLDGLSKLSPDLPAKEAGKIDEVLHDKAKAQALLQTPEAQRLIEQILGKK